LYKEDQEKKGKKDNKYFNNNSI